MPKTKNWIGKVKLGSKIYTVKLRETKTCYMDSDGLKFDKKTGVVILTDNEIIEAFFDAKLLCDTLKPSSDSSGKRLLQ